MILSKIWERYFLKELIKGLALFLFSFYLLYAIIDYSTRAKVIAKHPIPFEQLCAFYGCMFVRRIDLILPFGLLLTQIRTLCNLNLNNELTALRAAGIRLKRLMRPSLVLGVTLCMTLLCVQEYILPQSQLLYRFIEDQYLQEGKSRKLAANQDFHDLRLKDNTLLIYKNYNSADRSFSDVFWVLNANEFYRIKNLSVNNQVVEARWVEEFKRNSKEQIELKSSIEKREFTELTLSEEVLHQVVAGHKDQALSKLWTQFPHASSSLTDREASAATYFHHKLAMPWLCLLVILGPAPFCMRFGRQLHVFLIYSICILMFIAFFLVMDATIVLGMHQALPPAIAAWGPFIPFALMAFFSYAKMR